MKAFGRALLALACLPTTLAGYAWVLTLWGIWGGRFRHGLRWHRGILTCELRPDGWPARSWYRGIAATTVGRAISFGPGFRSLSEVWRHEKAHVDQYEMAGLLGALLGVLVLLMTSSSFTALVIWILCPGMMQGSGFLHAWLAGQHPYFGSPNERAAYALQSKPSHDDLTPVDP